ncbi:MAG: hypothetical protein PHC37_02375 [Candidatus Omnitrophica bacterium]|nr:hypothetical protein [Candidatus Omnitrophota bacterium]MDD5690533.1 hypothetical protein [Candidatus Omnitrophota bacterium]
MNKETALLYSGGTDSTLTACLAAKQFDKVHLITYRRFGLFSITNPLINVKKLKDKFGEDKFTHTTISIDKLFKKVSYENFLANLIKYRLSLLSTCGLCKLTMHIRTIIYCLRNNITYACDGANQGMYFFPDQMDGVINETKKMYLNFGINYFNPVFEFEGPQDIDFSDRLHLERLPVFQSEENNLHAAGWKEKTTGYKLYSLGLMPSENVKGSKLDRQMQPRCFQFILFNIWLHWYYLNSHTYEEYKELSLIFFKDKIATFTKLIAEYLEKGKKGRLSNLLED